MRAGGGIPERTDPDGAEGKSLLKTEFVAYTESLLRIYSLAQAEFVTYILYVK